jgi:DNA-binding GntR family transcriptional regulator
MGQEVGFFGSLEHLNPEMFQKENIPDQLSNYLRGLIMNGKLRSGERIVETQFSRNLRLGQPTVREALRTLEGEGLVVRRPGRGCFVAQLTRKEVGQIFRLRIELEVLAVKWALESTPRTDFGRLEVQLHALRDAAEKEDVLNFYHEDLEFHKAVWHMSGNPFIVNALTRISVPLFAFVMIEVAQKADFDLRANVREHEKIYSSIVGGDREFALRTVREVLEGFWQQGIQIVGNSGSERP